MKSGVAIIVFTTHSSSSISGDVGGSRGHGVGVRVRVGLAAGVVVLGVQAVVGVMLVVIAGVGGRV